MGSGKRGQGPRRAQAALVAANFFAQCGFQGVYFVGIIGSATYGLGADAYLVSALVFVMNIALVAGAMAAGVLIDRVGPRRTMAASLAIFCATGLISWLAPLSAGLLFFAAGMQGFIFGALSTAIESFPPFLVVGRAELQQLNTWITTSRNVSVIVGPAIGGALSAWRGAQASFVLVVVMSLLGMGAARGCRELVRPAAVKAAGAVEADDGVPSRRRGGAFAQLADGVRYVFSRKFLAMLFWFGFLGYFAYGAFDSLESLFYRDILGVGVDWMGWLNVVSGVGAVIGSAAVARIPTRKLSLGLLSVLLLVTGLGSMLYVGTPWVLVAAAGQLVTSFGFGASAPVRAVLTQEGTDLAYMGRVNSVVKVGLNVAGTVPLLVAPFLADAFGVQPVLVGASAFVAAVALVLLALSRKMEREGKQP